MKSSPEPCSYQMDAFQLFTLILTRFDAKGLNGPLLIVYIKG